MAAMGKPKAICACCASPLPFFRVLPRQALTQKLRAGPNDLAIWSHDHHGKRVEEVWRLPQPADLLNCRIVGGMWLALQQTDVIRTIRLLHQPVTNVDEDHRPELRLM